MNDVFSPEGKIGLLTLKTMKEYWLGFDDTGGYCSPGNRIYGTYFGPLYVNTKAVYKMFQKRFYVQNESDDTGLPNKRLHTFFQRVDGNVIMYICDINEDIVYYSDVGDDDPCEEYIPASLLGEIPDGLEKDFILKKLKKK